MHRELTITAKPYKSSNLAVPTTPFSPRSPLTSASPPTKRGNSIDRAWGFRRLEFPPPPQQPLHWLWQCHVCNRCYQLGVTRRCLDDGHYFCSGTTTVKRSKRNGNRRVIRHKSCASEFDYQAWKAWAHWRRSVIEQAQAAAALEKLFEGDGVPLVMPSPADTWNDAMRNSCHKDCWNSCDYPSECRWGRQLGFNTPTAESPASVTVPSTPVPTIPEQPGPQDLTQFVDVPMDVDGPAQLSPEHFSDPVSRTPLTSPEEEIKQPSMDDLLESAKRRKRRSAGFVASPLASNPSSSSSSSSYAGSDSGSFTALALQKAFDDFELDFRKSFGRAGAFVSNFVSSKRNNLALDVDMAEKGMKVGRKKSTSSPS